MDQAVWHAVLEDYTLHLIHMLPARSPGRNKVESASFTVRSCKKHEASTCQCLCHEPCESGF